MVRNIYILREIIKNLELILIIIYGYHYFTLIYEKM